MDHDRTMKVNRLRGLALTVERGECDADLAECGVPISDRLVRRLRELADKMELTGR